MIVLIRRLQNFRKEHRTEGPGNRQSLAIRHCDAGSCNGCEHELNLLSSPYHDIQRFGLSLVSSPRHADILLVSGSVTSGMREPLLAAHSAMPEPKKVIALGNCAIGEGLLGNSELTGLGVSQLLPVDAAIPGCPPTPEKIVSAILALTKKS